MNVEERRNMKSEIIYLFISMKGVKFMCDGTQRSNFVLDGLICNHIRTAASVQSCIFDVLVILIKNKRGVCTFRCMVGTDNGTAICDLIQNWYYFLLIFKAQMPLIKSMKNIQQDKIKECFVFGCTSFLIWESGSLQCSQVVP